jgi:hypothetical protein
MEKNENVDNFFDSSSCNLSSLIASILKKFAEIDSGCMAKLQQLAPEVVNDISQSKPSSDTNISGSASDSEKRKAKARERQAAILVRFILFLLYGFLLATLQENGKTNLYVRIEMNGI